MTVLIGELIVTSYRSVPNQTDNTPYHTSTYTHVEGGGIAISRDLLCGACRKLHKRCEHPEYDKKVHYGDWLYIDTYGFKFVNDCMGEYSITKYKQQLVKRKIVNQVDMWVRTREQEKAVGMSKLLVYKVKEVN